MSATTPGQAAFSDKDSGNGQQQSAIDRRLDEELAETFPASDPPSAIIPGAGETPRPQDTDQSDDADKNKSG